MAPAPDPIVLRGHGADVQCVTFAYIDGVQCVLSGCVTRPRGKQPRREWEGGLRGDWTINEKKKKK